MDTYSITVQKEDSGKKIKSLLSEKYKISSHMLSSLKRTDGIKLNGKSARVTESVQEGDLITITLKEEKISENILPVNLPLDIVYEDSDILAVNKPKDMPVHPSMGNFMNTLGNAVMYYYKDREFVYRPVNRLDRDTTGIAVIAKNRICANIISEHMKSGKFKKTYFALLDGTLEQKSGFISAPIARESESVIKRCVSENGKEALTEYEIIESYNNISLAKILLHTGRTHQIRVHFAHIGCPLLYDYLYGKEVEGKTFFLHCARVEFPHPVTGKTLVLERRAEFSPKEIKNT